MKIYAVILIAFGGIGILPGNALANPWGLDPSYLILSKTEWQKVNSVAFADMVLGCGVKRGMLKPKDAAKVINSTAKWWANSNYGITLTDSDINYARTRLLGPGPPHKYKGHLAKMIQGLGGCTAIVNLPMPSKMIAGLRNIAGGYSNQAPLGELMEGTPFEW